MLTNATWVISGGPSFSDPSDQALRDPTKTPLDRRFPASVTVGFIISEGIGRSGFRKVRMGDFRVGRSAVKIIPKR